MSARNNGTPHRPPDDLDVARAEWGQAIQDLIELRKALREPGGTGADLQERARAAEDRLRRATTRLSSLKREPEDSAAS